MELLLFEFVLGEVGGGRNGRTGLKMREKEENDLTMYPKVFVHS